MGEINYQRLFVGGLIAGVVFIIGHVLFSTIFSAAVEQWMQAMNLTAPAGSAVIGLSLLILSLGVAAVWLYSAIRPRFGAGPITAAIAGVFLWAVVVVFPSVTNAFFGVPIDGGFWLYLTWWLVVSPAGTIAGAWAYQEASEAAPAAVAFAQPVADDHSSHPAPLQ